MGEDQRRRRRDWVEAADGLPGVSEDDMSRRNGQRKLGTTRGSPRRTRTAKASRRSRVAVKSRCACEWGGWGREVMRDRDSIPRTGARGPGGERPARLERRCIPESSSLTLIGACCRTTGCTKDGGKPGGGKGMPGAGLTEPPYGKALSDRPALKPYWGKPAVRNFRGDDGNVGIMRSPVRAIVLPGTSPRPDLARGRGGQPPGLLYNGILAPVSVGVHPQPPAAWTPHRLCIQLPALA